MTTLIRERLYEVIMWDYDAAPGAADYFSQNYNDEELAQSILPYYCRRRLHTGDLEKAKALARGAVEIDYYAGAAAFFQGKLIEGHGLVFDYKERYL